MARFPAFLFFGLLVSCGQQHSESNARIITVSIAPFSYFVEEIGGNDFSVNVMVPPGADPHVYEPFPGQISKLRSSSGYISDGYLGFEMIWLEKFYETNRMMQKLSLNKNIRPLVSADPHEGGHVEGADPHYWVSPACALIMALSVKDFLCGLNPEGKDRYEKNYADLAAKIRTLDKKAQDLFSGVQKKSFMIFHPNLGYLARDYGLEEIPVEYEGKEPSPSRVKVLIDRARNEGIKTIFVQREYDTKNARAIAAETGGEIKIIDPLSADWFQTTSDIIDAVYRSLAEKKQ